MKSMLSITTPYPLRKWLGLSALLLAGWLLLSPTAEAQEQHAGRANTPPGALKAIEVNLVKLQRPITLRFEAATVREALDAVAAEADLHVVRGNQEVLSSRRVTLDFRETTVLEALHTITEGTGLRLMISPNGYLILSDRPTMGAPTHLTESPAPPAPVVGTLTGRVIDGASGDPLPGVNVVIDGTTRGASTDIDGRYTIPDVEPGAYSLTASFIGYGQERQEGVVVQSGKATVVDFALEPEELGLDEVVVVGYGTQQRRDLTGAVSSVSAEDIQRLPVTSVDQALQGQAAGVQVTQTSGEPGGAVRIRIRGGTSINAGNNPLYVIDGVPIGGGGNLDTGAQSYRDASDMNALATLNPRDIESIEVLKDASATAIYGARGANGVIIVTTKRGRPGGAQINFDAYTGVQQVIDTYDMMNAGEYMEMVNAVEAAGGKPAVYSQAEITAAGEGTDWQDAIYRSAPMQNYQLSASGGNENIRYSVQGSYLDQQGIVVESDLQRYALRLNLDATPNTRLRFGNNFTMTYTESSRVNTSGRRNNNGSSVIAGAMQMPALLPVYRSDGSFSQVADIGLALDIDHPMANAASPHMARSLRALGNLFTEYDIIPRLRARVSLGFDLLDLKENVYYLRSTIMGQSSNGLGRIGASQGRTWLNENTLTYSDQEGANRYTILAGFTMQKSYNESVLASAGGFVNDILSYNNLGSASLAQFPSSGASSWGLASWIGRVNYTLADRYLLTVTGRYDGSSRFGENNRWAFFPSAALGWLLSEEPFAQNLPVLNALKLRASYGVTGNQEIGLYRSLARLGTGSYVFGGNVVTGFRPVSVPNPDLRWEKTAQLDIGFDLGLLDNRITLIGDYYNKKTTDLLLEVPLPSETGFASALQNIGAVRNRGVELTLNSINVTGAFNWTTDVNFSANRNEVLDLGEITEFFASATTDGINSTQIVRVGEPIGTIYGNVVEGMFQTPEEVAVSAQKNARPGTWRFRDVDGNGTFNEAADRTILGYAEPDFTLGLTNRLRYGGAELSFFIQGVFGNEIVNMNKTRFLGLEGKGAGNKFAESLNYWRPDNPNTMVQTPGAGTGYVFTINNLHVEDGTYVRLRDVTLAYNVPQSLIRRLSARTLRLYISGQNLLTLTGYDGLDPEVGFWGDNNLTPGLDFGGYPPSRSYTLGVSLGF